MKANQIRTDRLYLTLMSEEELTQAVENCEEESLRDRFSRMLSESQKTPDMREFSVPWTVTDKKSGDELGKIAVLGNSSDGWLNLWYLFSSQSIQDGIFMEALSGILEWTFSQRDIYFVDAKVSGEQPAAARVLLQRGFKKTDDNKKSNLYTMTRENITWPPFFMGIFMCLGILIGIPAGVLIYAIPVSAAVGLLAGAVFGWIQSKKREPFVKKHEEHLQMR